MHSAKRVLVVGPFYGELGYEVGNWLPHVNFHVRAARWDAVHVFCIEGHEALYSFVPGAEYHAQPFRYVQTQQEGNYLMEHKNPEAVRSCACGYSEAALLVNRLYVAHQWRIHVLPLRCTPDDHHVLYPLAAPVLLNPHEQLYEGWRDRLNTGLPTVVICYRGYRRGPAKNTRPEILGSLTQELAHRGLEPVVVGRCEPGAEPKVAAGFNLINQTDIGDLIAIFRGAACVVGASSGTMHLAAACGAPHVTWGGERPWGPVTRQRYEWVWNPNGTWCRFLDTPDYAWEIEIERVLAAVADAVTLPNPCVRPKGETERP